MPSSVIVPASPGFVDPQIPIKRSFKAAKDVIKAAIIAANPGAASLTFGDLKVVVDKDQHQLTLSILPSAPNVYNIGGSKVGTTVFTYNDIDFGTVMKDVLGFADTYSEGRKDAVIAALPAGVSHSYEASTQILTVTVDATATEVQFTDENTVPSTVLFAGKTFQIQFVDLQLDLSTVLTNRNLTLVVSDLVTPAEA